MASKTRTNSRQDKTFIGGYFEEDVHTALRILAARNRTTGQALVREALALLFARYGVEQII